MVLCEEIEENSKLEMDGLSKYLIYSKFHCNCDFHPTTCKRVQIKCEVIYERFHI